MPRFSRFRQAKVLVLQAYCKQIEDHDIDNKKVTSARADRTNWRDLASGSAVEAIARGIHNQWGLWVGVSTRAGLVIPIYGDRKLVQAAPMCDHFIGRIDSTGSCSSSLLSWSIGHTNQGAVCHAGLQAEVVSLGDAGCVFASGFLSGDEQIGTSKLLERASQLHIDRQDVASRLVGVPRLSHSDRKAVRVLLESIRELMVEEDPREFGQDKARNDYSNIVGQSPAILKLFGLLDRVTRNDSTVLVQGENGTGKELIARAIHANSQRNKMGFVTQNCSALNDNLLDSELFGHTRGAFTGAIADKRGLFEVADGGTLFLDEIGDMSTTMQVKLLRVLQEGTFLPVGDTVTRKVDVRIIAASNRILRDMVREGTFREDLFYRLNVITMVVPPLRKRRADIPLLLDHFLHEFAQQSKSAQKALMPETSDMLVAYDWPGNVRELRHEVERLAVLSGHDELIEPDLVSRRIVEDVDPNRILDDPDEYGTLPEAVEALERRMILEALQATGWNKSRTAKKLGISRRNLIRKVQAFQLKPRQSS